MNSFSERLKALRNKRGLTQKQLGEATGLSARGIQDYELEQRKPGLDALFALADYFDVPLDYLTGRGIFENWEQIMECKDEIIDQLEEIFPTAKEFGLRNRSENSLMYLFPAFIHHVEIDTAIKIYLLP